MEALREAIVRGKFADASHVEGTLSLADLERSLSLAQKELAECKVRLSREGWLIAYRTS